MLTFSGLIRIFNLIKSIALLICRWSTERRDLPADPNLDSPFARHLVSYLFLSKLSKKPNPKHVEVTGRVILQNLKNYVERRIHDIWIGLCSEACLSALNKHLYPSQSPPIPSTCGCITKVTVIAGMRPPGPTLDNPGKSSTARPHRARSTGRAIPKGGEFP